MSASLTDKITDTRNAARPNSARVTSGRSAGGATLACDNLAGWPTPSKVHFVTYKIDSNSAVVTGSQLDCYGIVSGNNIGSFTVVDGTDTGHAVGDVVEMLPTAAWGQDLADALGVGHSRAGAHVANLPLTTPVLTTPVIDDFTSAVHDHIDAEGGGQIANAGISGVGVEKFSNPYKFSVYRNAAQNTTGGAYTKVAFDTKTFDTGTNFDVVANNRFTAPVAGFYWLYSNVAFSVATSQIYKLGLYKNGSIVREGGTGFSTTAGVTSYAPSVGGLFSLAANDYIEIFSLANSTTEALIVGSAFTYFEGFLMSIT